MQQNNSVQTFTVESEQPNFQPVETLNTSVNTQSMLPQPTYASLDVRDDLLTVAETSEGSSTLVKEPLLQKDVTGAIVSWLRQSAQERHRQYIAAQVPAQLYPDLLSTLWLQEDIVPFQGGSSQQTLEEQVKDLAARFDSNDIVRQRLGAHNEVLVSELVTLEDYQKTASSEDFALLQGLTEALRGKNLAFINATPQGGGVALMRHALIRLLRLLEVDAHWYVLQPDKDVFDITKSKFHNVLQAVANPDVVLTDADKALYETWIQKNAQMLDEVFRGADVVVIDDPQPSGLIPYIKHVNPQAKILYRSHIQIVARLASMAGTSQHVTWSYLWNNIQHANYFISHPMSMFIPSEVPAHKILYMPATTDPLDGLNKPLSDEQISIYLRMFNRILVEHHQLPLEADRPYIVQIARFDPSKGIPDVIEAYRQLRVKLEEHMQPVPQLVIAGVGSVDDPDGVPIYNYVMQLLASPHYAHLASDVKVARLPHRDQLLNALLRKAHIALQLSIKEGFEVKVTEALMKGKPVVAYNVGGIPLQIQEGISGHLVEAGETSRVADLLFDLLTDCGKYQQMSKAAVEHAGKDYLTVPNAICWLYLAHLLINCEGLKGDYQWVRALAQRFLVEEQEAA